MVSIYALINPISSAVFYIGASKHPSKRLIEHINDAKYDTVNPNFKNKQIQVIAESGGVPEMEILDSFPHTEIPFWETFYIDLFRSYGFELNQMRLSNYSFRPEYSKGQPIQVVSIKVTDKAFRSMELLSKITQRQLNDIFHSAIREYTMGVLNGKEGDDTREAFRMAIADEFGDYPKPYTFM